MRALPHIVCAAPRDEPMLQRMLRTALLQDEGPFALRYPRGQGPGGTLLVPDAITPVEIGQGEVLAEGDGRVALVGYGTGVAKALEAAGLLTQAGIVATVADARFAKPIDVDLMARLSTDHELVVTLEEGVLSGGFGSGVWEALNEAGLDDPVNGHARLMRIGMPDRYVTHGKPPLLHEEVGFTGRAIARRVADTLGVDFADVLAQA
jgi:1-deoxy-D-xylulose-5-phosphate synthase